MTMTKAELIEGLITGCEFDKYDAKDLVEGLFEEIRRQLEEGIEVKISGFGNFGLRDKNARPGRNPKTGEEIPVCARRVVTFRPGQKLRERVEAFAGEPVPKELERA